MKIISGKHKNRIIPTLKESVYRPSTSKFREALFSILFSGEFSELKPVENALVLDLFAGSGALSFEALSRGAKQITLIDTNKELLDMALKFAKTIGEQDNITCLTNDATCLPWSGKKYNMVFIDPPYHKNYIEKTLSCLCKNEWLDHGAIISIEVGKYDNVNLEKDFILIKEKTYGNSKLLIIKYE